MPYLRRVMRPRRGLGDAAADTLWCGGSFANWLFSGNCWAQPYSAWQTAMYEATTAAPPAPSGAALTVPPASGESAAALGQSISNQQMANEQAIAAGGVQSSLADQAASTVIGATDAAGNLISNLNPLNLLPSIPWGTIALVGVIVVLAFSALGARSPRRSGR